MESDYCNASKGMTDEARIHRLAMILASYAPSNDCEKFIQNFVSYPHESTDAERLMELVSAIHDGLAYGNWPWVIAAMNDGLDTLRGK